MNTINKFGKILLSIYAVSFLLSIAFSAGAFVPAEHGPRTGYSSSPLGVPTTSQYCNLNWWNCEQKPAELAPAMIQDRETLIRQLKIQILQLQIQILELQLKSLVRL